MKYFILGEDSILAGNNFKNEIRVVIRNNNDFLIHCLYESRVQRYQIQRTNFKKLLFMGSTNFLLYPVGELKFFQPVDEIEIEGVWCKPSPARGSVSLFKNGTLIFANYANFFGNKNEK